MESRGATIWWHQITPNGSGVASVATFLYMGFLFSKKGDIKGYVKIVPWF